MYIIRLTFMRECKVHSHLKHFEFVYLSNLEWRNIDKNNNIDLYIYHGLLLSVYYS